MQAGARIIDITHFQLVSILNGSTSVAKELVEPGGGGYGGTLWNFLKNKQMFLGNTVSTKAQKEWFQQFQRA